jgi:hypothetical protein
MDGRRQPFRPPTALLAQVERALDEFPAVVAGDFSQTKPVSLSNTASLLKQHLVPPQRIIALAAPRDGSLDLIELA